MQFGAWADEYCVNVADVAHWVENTIADERIDADIDETTGYCLSTLCWLDTFDIRILAVETPVFNPGEGYIGTTDAWASPGKGPLAGEVWLLEAKSSESSSINHGYQEAAYLRAPWAIPGQGVVELQEPPTPDRIVTLLVQPGSVTPREWTRDQIPDLYAGFLACKKVYDQRKGITPTTLKQYRFKEIL
jgi:hypothetical protein